jgi:anti-anti-sigma factor
MKQGGSARKDLASAPAIAPPLHDHREIKRCCKIVLPAIEYPFPAAINAYAEDANQGTIAWAHSYGLMPSDPAGRHRHEEYGYFAARVHPNASRQTLQIAADFIAWLFFADDHNDETETGIRIDWMTERLARFSAVLQGERPARSDSPLCHALFDLRTRASQWVHSSWMTQFKRSMIEYFAAGRWECENRQLGAALSPATYLAMRPFTGAVYPCFDLFAVTDALRLPDAAREHPVVQALRLRANNVISACNDIFSLEKELAHGDMHNLALAILNEQRCSLQQAVDRAAAWHDAEVGAYLALERSLPSFGAVVDADLVRYTGQWLFRRGKATIAVTMNEDELAFYADVAARVFRKGGERARSDMIATLHRLGLDNAQAAEVIAHALVHDVFNEDKSSKTLAPPPSQSQSTEWKRRAGFFAILQKTLPIVVWELDLQGVLLSMDGRGLEGTGLGQEYFVGKSALEIFAGEEFVKSLQQAVTGQHVHVIAEYGGIPWEMWCTPIHDEHGQLASVLGVTLDISEAKRMEKELRAQLDLIEEQARVIRTLSTPIIEVWDGVLTLPLLGFFDSRRASAVMENLLSHIARTRARFAILDLTGVEVMDSETATHLLQLIEAIRLLGAEGIITGIQPNVSKTMVALGLELKGIVTLANLREGLHRCIRLMRNAAA